MKRTGHRRRGLDQVHRLLGRMRRGRCGDCAKWIYATGKSAKRAAAIAHPDEADVLVVYPCPAGRGFHYGHNQWQATG